MKRHLLTISHITPHVGGGVGSVIKDFISLSSSFNIEHNLFCLDKSQTNFCEILVNGIKLESLSYQSDSYFIELLRESDVILIHYWNHPLLAKFLACALLPPCRLLVWCHNSGLQEPHIIPKYLVRMAHKVIFTSNCSMKAPNLQNEIRSWPSRFGVVHSTHDLNPFYNVGKNRRPSKSLSKLLYVGTVSKSKMHSDSAYIFSLLSKSGFEICVTGGPDHLALQQEVFSLGGHIEVCGHNKSVLQFYQDADLFIYPLRPDHYGTGEQVILEAMASGLPVIAFSNPAELEIILSGKTGILVSSSHDFLNAIHSISMDVNFYKSMSTNAMKRASYKFDSNIMVKKLLGHVKEVMVFEKLTLLRNDATLKNVFDIFIMNTFFDEEFCINYQKINGEEINSEKVSQVFSKIRSQLISADMAYLWTAKTKSSPFHYLSYFPDDRELRFFTEMISDELSNMALFSKSASKS
ncbi:TPA: glycosyltransferase family 4 protein [Aeromonas veronii]